MWKKMLKLSNTVKVLEKHQKASKKDAGYHI